MNLASINFLKIIYANVKTLSMKMKQIDDLHFNKQVQSPKSLYIEIKKNFSLLNLLNFF
jgi:uncharacterized protein YlbG (UPF0298 family)